MMADREKVIKGLECCTFILGKRKCNECPYQKDNGCYQLQDDFHALLKEQESVRVGKKIKAGDVVLDFYQCGHCKKAIRKPWRYCPFCGKAVKWE